jgi:lysozyme
MKTSQAGIALIKHHEGLRLKAYRDAVGVWTIGYGHTRGVTNGQTITPAQADGFLGVDLLLFEATIVQLVTVRLNQGQFDALVSFAFNIGAGKFRTSTLLRELNKGHYDAVPAQLMRWTKGNVNGRMIELPGLVTRRRDEAALWRGLPVSGQSTLAHGGRASPPPEPTPQPVAATAPAATAVGGTAVLAGELYKQFSDAATQAQPFLSLGRVGLLVGIALVIGAVALIAYRWRNRNN